LIIVARTRGWIKAPDNKPNEETFELPPYGVEVRQTLPDQTLPDQVEAEKQLKHANEQLSLANVYPGRGRQQPCGLPRQGLDGAALAPPRSNTR
jgi:hypothetical protein